MVVRVKWLKREIEEEEDETQKNLGTYESTIRMTIRIGNPYGPNGSAIRMTIWIANPYVHTDQQSANPYGPYKFV